VLTPSYKAWLYRYTLKTIKFASVTGLPAHFVIAVL
jgi:hypothetical protein